MNITLFLVLLIIFLYVLSPLLSHSKCCASCGSTELEVSFSGHPIYKCTRCGCVNINGLNRQV